MPADGQWAHVGTLLPVQSLSTVRYNFKGIPTLPGVYAFSLHGQIVYIGSAVNLRKRISAHVNSRRWVGGISVRVAVTLHDWRGRERRLIERLRPRSNRQWAHGPARLGSLEWACLSKFGEGR